MSLTPTFKYISPAQLAAMIKAVPPSAIRDFAIIDVRDSDFVGGNIVHAVNYPSEQFVTSVKGLVDKLREVPTVIFHCALSQQRGPKAARIYAESRSLILPESKVKPQEILVLRGGFSEFQSRYRDDPELVEKFDKRFHD